MTARTLYDKLWDDHVLHTEEDGTSVLYIDRHLLHEVTSPQAFEGLEIADRKVWRLSANLAVSDHNVPTTDRRQGIADPTSRLQVDTLDANCDKQGITQFKMNDKRQGIVHVIGPEQGATLPGMTVVCGDSHTSTHGAFGALAHGIGTSEVEHVLATQTLLAKKAKNMLVRVDGTLPRGCSAKDIVLAIIGVIGTAGGTGYTIEFGGSAIRALSMEGRMTVCNMAIEAGARAGLVAVDDTTLAYVKGRPFSPTGVEWDQAVAYWRNLHSDAGAHFDRVVEIDAATIRPQVTWGTSPEMVLSIEDRVPDPEREKDDVKRGAMERALTYMALEPNKAIAGLTRCVRPPAPCRPSKLRLLVDAQRSPGSRRSAFIARHIEQPGSRHSKPALVKTLSRPSRSACSFTRPEPGTTIARRTFSAMRPPTRRTTAAASRRSSMRLLVHEPMNTLSMRMSAIALLGSSAM